MEVPVNKGTLLSEVRVSLFKGVSQTSRECGWRERCVTCGSRSMVQESTSLGLGRVSVLNLQVRVYSSIDLSVPLEMSPFNITHSRSQIE